MKYLLKALWNRVRHHKEIDLIVKEVSYNNGDFRVTLEHPGFSILAEEIAKMFRHYEALNFLETTLFDTATMRQYTITVQDKTRLTPLEVIKILRGALEDIALDEERTYARDFAAFARQAAVVALTEVGYLKSEEG